MVKLAALCAACKLYRKVGQGETLLANVRGYGDSPEENSLSPSPLPVFLI